VRQAVGPWRVVGWHTAYAVRGPDAVRAMPGGGAWVDAIEKSAAPAERHLLTFEGHVTHLTDRDLDLLDHMDVQTMVGEADAVGRAVADLAGAGFAEAIYTPAGPDVPRELKAFAEAGGNPAAAGRDRKDWH
jgi:5,10-methylenetetrahydromethanopterin reductase